MLKELYVENLAVIEQVSMEFSRGLTVFTGETGAGKSILIDAINLVLGQRASKEVVRTGAKKAVVSAVFSDLTEEAEQLLAQYGFEPENGEVILTREIGADGRSAARLMGRPVTAGMLQELGLKLVTIHGQHDSQGLLAPDRHLGILDDFAGDDQAFAAYRKEYLRYQKLKTDYRSHNMDEQEKARRIDLLSYQSQEIAAADPKLGEDDELDQQLQLMRNSEKISRCLEEAYLALYGDDNGGGCYEQMNTAVHALEEIAGYNNELDKAAEHLDGIQYEIQEAAESISDFLERLEFNPALMEQMQQRQNELEQLKRKYGSTMEEVLAYREQVEKELSGLQLSEQTQNELRQQLTEQKQRVMDAGQKLSELRRKAGRVFVERVGKVLSFLDMPGIQLQVRQEKGKYGPRGCDEVEFLFSVNRGEELRSISKVASGGELSRIMLAIKSVLAERDSIGTLIFDEIDTGVSGKSAQKIGMKLKQTAAGTQQVLCVTHSAQIAALAQNHFLIRKQVEGERTYTRVFPLDLEGRVQEVARIMATDRITDLMLQNAREMILSGAVPE